MYATVRNYKGIDPKRTDEVTRKIDETLMPRLSKLPGFNGYYVIKADDGIMTSFGIFDTAAQADESTRVAASWVRDEKLEGALPNPPHITSGEILVHKTTTNGAVRA